MKVTALFLSVDLHRYGLHKFSLIPFGDIDFFQVVVQIGPLVAAQHPGGQANDGPQMHGGIMLGRMFGQLVNLGVTVVARSNTVIRIGGNNLVQLFLAIRQPFFLIGILQEAAATTAAVVVGHIGGHIDKVFFPNTGLDYIP